MDSQFSVDEIMRLLETEDGYWAVRARIDDAFDSEANWPALVALHGRLLTSSGESEASFRRAIADRMALTPGPDACGFGIDLLLAERSIRPRTEDAERLTQNRSWPELEPLLGERLDHSPERMLFSAEVILCAGLRGEDVAGSKLTWIVWNELERRDHELAWLPPNRHVLETELDLHHYSERGGSARSVGEFAGPAAEHVESDQIALEPRTLAPARVARVLSAFSIDHRCDGGVQLDSWLARPAARSNSATDRAISQAFKPAQGSPGPLMRLTAAQAVGAVAEAAIHGGAHGGDLGMVRGRLVAWRALGALAEQPVTASFRAIVDAVESSTWLCIDPRAPWFIQTAWDGSVVRIAPDGRVVTALAWTDTD